jgi:microcompartment protein CcmK/EutM
MLLGRVVGTVWSTRHDPTVDDLKFLVVQRLGLDGALKDDFVVSVDAVGAGVGETVLVAQGSSGRQTELTQNRPVDAVITHIVDDLEVVCRDWAEFDTKAVEDLRA